MKKGFWILAGSLLLALPGAVDQAYAIKAGRLIDGQNAGAKTNVVIIVQGNKITEIGEKAAVPKGAVPIDLGDKTVLPGFINAHTHIMIDGGTDYGANLYKKSMPYRALEAASNCR
jgi:imidazolonepropionase-like amidohydrolase